MSLLQVVLTLGLWLFMSNFDRRGGIFSVANALSSKSIRYRTAKEADISNIVNLLMDTFEKDDIPAWNIVQRKLVMDGYQRQMEQRLEMCQQGRQHALIVAVDDGNNKENIAGFMELGTMPSPIPIKVNTTWNDAVVETTIQPELPFLANLAINSNYRRQGIGTKLVQLAIKVSTKWCNVITSSDASDNDNLTDKHTTDKTAQTPASMYLAVDKENTAAVRLYDGLNFCRVLDETERTWSSKKLERQLKKRKPRLYFEKKLDVSAGVGSPTTTEK